AGHVPAARAATRRRTSLREGVLRTMSLIKFNSLIAVLFTGLATAVGIAALVAPQAMTAAEKDPAEKAGRGSRHDLTPESFAKLHALIRPQENEWRHLKVQWLTDVVAARKRAAAEDKPIVICYTGGAGYNEPLGTCLSAAASRLAGGSAGYPEEDIKLRN